MLACPPTCQPTSVSQGQSGGGITYLWCQALPRECSVSSCPVNVPTQGQLSPPRKRKDKCKLPWPVSQEQERQVGKDEVGTGQEDSHEQPCGHTVLCTDLHTHGCCLTAQVRTLRPRLPMSRMRPGRGQGHLGASQRQQGEKEPELWNPAAWL